MWPIWLSKVQIKQKTDESHISIKYYYSQCSGHFGSQKFKSNKKLMNHTFLSDITIYNAVAMVALASAAPQFQGDSSNAIILQEQRWAGLCFCVFLYLCIMYIIYAFLFIAVYCCITYIINVFLCILLIFNWSPPPVPSKRPAEDQRFKVIFLLVLNGARTSQKTVCTIVRTCNEY